MKIGIFKLKEHRFRETGIAVPMIFKKTDAGWPGKIILLIDYNKRFVCDEASNKFIASYQLPFPDSLAAGDMIKDPLQNRVWFCTGKEGYVLLDRNRSVQLPGHNTANDPVIEQQQGNIKKRVPLFPKGWNFWMVSWILWKYPTVCYLWQSYWHYLTLYTINGRTQKNYYEVWGILPAKTEHSGSWNEPALLLQQGVE